MGMKENSEKKILKSIMTRMEFIIGIFEHDLRNKSTILQKKLSFVNIYKSMLVRYKLQSKSIIIIYIRQWECYYPN